MQTWYYLRMIPRIYARFTRISNLYSRMIRLRISNLYSRKLTAYIKPLFTHDTHDTYYTHKAICWCSSSLVAKLDPCLPAQIQVDDASHPETYSDENADLAEFRHMPHLAAWGKGCADSPPCICLSCLHFLSTFNGWRISGESTWEGLRPIRHHKVLDRHADSLRSDLGEDSAMSDLRKGLMNSLLLTPVGSSSLHRSIPTGWAALEDVRRVVLSRN